MHLYTKYQKTCKYIQNTILIFNYRLCEVNFYLRIRTKGQPKNTYEIINIVILHTSAVTIKQNNIAYSIIR